jgi:membrane protease YdiL (CAAX protease family)
LIAMLFIRLKKATSLKTALIVVASLFAAGHIPAMISKGFPIEEFYSLFLDAGLGFFLIYTINKTKDILWFWMVHFAMDMMQFYA